MNTSRIRKLLLPFFLIFALGSTALYAANTSTASSEKLDDQYQEMKKKCHMLRIWFIVDIPLSLDGDGERCSWDWFPE